TAGVAAHGPLVAGRLLRLATAPAKAVLLGPGQDLAGETERRRHASVAFQQATTQAEPLAVGRQVRVIGEPPDAQRLIPPVTQPELQQGLQTAGLGPAPGEQRPSRTLRESPGALQQHPAAHLFRGDAGGPPLHQQATGNPSACTLRSARSSTSSRGSPRRRLPSSRKYSMLVRASARVSSNCSAGMCSDSSMCRWMKSPQLPTRRAARSQPRNQSPPRTLCSEGGTLARCNLSPPDSR